MVCAARAVGYLSSIRGPDTLRIRGQPHLGITLNLWTLWKLHKNKIRQRNLIGLKGPAFKEGH